MQGVVFPKRLNENDVVEVGFGIARDQDSLAVGRQITRGKFDFDYSHGVCLEKDLVALPACDDRAGCQTSSVIGFLIVSKEIDLCDWVDGKGVFGRLLENDYGFESVEIKNVLDDTAWAIVLAADA